MINILEIIKNNQKTTIYLSILALLDVFLSFFDKGLAVGLLLFAFLTAIVFIVLKRFKIDNKNIYILYTVIFLTHFAAVLFLYLTEMKALGGGADFDGYHQNAIEIANRFSHFNFSLEGLFTLHYFPVVIGVIYIFTLPVVIVGQMFVVWLACISIVLLYFLCLEIGASKKISFLVSLLLAIYPSYLYFGNVLLKDTIIIPIAISAMLVLIKVCKNFSWQKFILFFVLLTLLTHFRFYIGLAMLITFLISWILVSNKSMKVRVKYGIIFFVLLGFAPMLTGYGYYAISPMQQFFNKDAIKNFREVVYAPSDLFQKSDECARCERSLNNLTEINLDNIEENACFICYKTDNAGSGSSFLVATSFDNPVSFMKNYVISFASSVFGPLPWQLKYKRHLMFLVETIPVYIFTILILMSFIRVIKRNGLKRFIMLNKYIVPILLFAVISMGALSLYINNFGIIFRIRMPVFILFLSVLALALTIDKSLFKKNNKN